MIDGKLLKLIKNPILTYKKIIKTKNIKTIFFIKNIHSAIKNNIHLYGRFCNIKIVELDCDSKYLGSIFNRKNVYVFGVCE